MSDDAPAIPTEFQIYNSYEVDPIYQQKFSIAWASVAAFFILTAAPTLVWSVRSGRLRNGAIGVREDLCKYEPVNTENNSVLPSTRKKPAGKAFAIVSMLRALAAWTPPFIGLDVGQIVLVVAYYVAILLCITLNAELVDNPNRAGFLAIAQLPPVFLLATKNSPLAMLLSTGYEKLNFLHRWCSRGTVLAAAVHGSLWIRNHREYGLQILGAQKETSGVAAFALLCILVLSSLRFVRARAFQAFRLIHLLVVPAFVVTLCYHTLYAAPYIYPPLAFYGFDLFLRLLRYRVKDAALIAPDAHMTIVRVQGCTSGWSPGQHVRLRVFIASRMFESHPLTVMNAPQSTTCLGEIGMDRELLLGARVRGDWTQALNAYARENSIPLTAMEKKEFDLQSSDVGNVAISSEIVIENGPNEGPINVADLPPPSKIGNVKGTIVPESRDWSFGCEGTHVPVMLDGPYGGCALDLGTSESVLLVSGGSGVTFTLGLLDDLVGRCVRLNRCNGEVTHRIEFAWCLRSFGALRWVAPLLTTIALCATSPKSSINLHITVYVTCLCRPEDVPPVPNCDVVVERPNMRKLVNSFAWPCGSADDAESQEKVKTNCSNIAICAAGPEGLTAEAKNAAACLALRSPTRRVECHTEAYFL